MTIRETGLPFVPPSPNLKDPESLFHYPGTVLFEGTALSVGRGTEAPFRQIGAPWLDVPRVIAAAAAEPLAGVRFEEVEFTPRDPADGKFPGIPLRGLRLILTDAARYDPVRTAVTLLAAIQRVHPARIGFREAAFDRLAGGPGLREAIQSGRGPGDIVRGWQPALAAWRAARRPVLLYR
jgi:uncharacterized protein YbbC (DUF1343 family)